MGLSADEKTTVERPSDVDLVVTRTFNAPVRIVYEAWTKAELFQLWWAPKSNPVPMLSCELDVRVGGGYSVTFGKDADNAMTFFGKYLDVVPNQRMVWTNEESEDAAITTVTFEDQGDHTRLVLHERYPTKQALDDCYIGMEACTPEQFEQLDAVLETLNKGG